MSENRIPRHDDRLHNYDNIASPGKNKKNTIQMFTLLPEPNIVSARVNKTIGTLDFHNTGSTSSKDPVTIPSVGTDHCLKTTLVISYQDYSMGEVVKRIGVVDKKFGYGRGESDCSTSFQMILQTDASLTGWGAVCNGISIGGSWNMEERKLHINILELWAIYLGLRAFTKDKAVKAIHFQVDNIFALTYLRKMGGDKKSKVIGNIKNDLGVFTGKGNHNYCRIPPISIEHSGRSSITSRIEFHRMETLSKNFSKNLLKDSPTPVRPICLADLTLDSSMHLTGPRPIQSRNQCNASALGQAGSLCLSTFLNDIQSSEKGPERKRNNNDLNCSSMVWTTLVPGTSAFVQEDTPSVASIRQTFVKPSRGNPPTCCQQDLKFSGLDHYRVSLIKKGISAEAAKLISESRRKGSLSNYNSAWKKWASWCDQEQIDPFQCPVSDVINFLATCFHEDYEYQTIGVYRLAISAYHDLVEGKPIGQHSLISSLMTGIFNGHPPQPRYNFIWDVNTVLKYIKATWGNSKSISMKKLTYKVTMLLALATASRSCSIHNLDIRFLIKYNDKYVFKFHRLYKSWKKGAAPPSLDLHMFLEDPEICAVKTLDEYLSRSKAWRTKDETQLLISFISPHKAVTGSTVPGWIKKVLHLAGIDTNIFKGHSTRAASTTKASLSGFSVADILERGQWSRKSTWQQFYHKESATASERFQQSIFK